jgi:hypothetical protein
LAVRSAVPEKGDVNVKVQVAIAVVPAKVHVEIKKTGPPLDLISVSCVVTVPVGVVAPLVDVSVTVTVQLEPSLARTGLVQEIVVVGACNTLKDSQVLADGE